MKKPRAPRVPLPLRASGRVGFHYEIRPGEVCVTRAGICISARKGSRVYIRLLHGDVCHVWAEPVPK